MEVPVSDPQWWLLHTEDGMYHKLGSTYAGSTITSRCMAVAGQRFEVVDRRSIDPISGELCPGCWVSSDLQIDVYPTITVPRWIWPLVILVVGVIALATILAYAVHTGR